MKILYLAKHKGVEYDCIENGGSICASELKKTLPFKFENQKDKNLIDALTNNIPPHGPSDEFCIPPNWGSFHQPIMWRFCSQCQCAKSVHD